MAGRDAGDAQKASSRLFDPTAQSAIDERVKQKIETDLASQYDKSVQLKRDAQRGRHIGLGFASQ